MIAEEGTNFIEGGIAAGGKNGASVGRQIYALRSGYMHIFDLKLLKWSGVKVRLLREG